VRNEMWRHDAVMSDAFVLHGSAAVEAAV